MKVKIASVCVHEYNQFTLKVYYARSVLSLEKIQQTDKGKYKNIWTAKIIFNQLPQAIKRKFATMKQLYNFLSLKDNFQIKPSYFLLLMEQNTLELPIKWFSFIHTLFLQELLKEISNITQTSGLVNQQQSKTNRENSSYYQSIGAKVKKEQMKKIAQRMKKASRDKTIQNYIMISGRDKGKINRYRFGLIGMLLPMDRNQAKIDFVSFAAETEDAREKMKEVNMEKKQLKQKTENYYQSLYHFNKSYEYNKRNAKNCLQWYTKDSFFYRVLNKGLRLINDPQQLLILRLPFQDLFFSIKEIYDESKDNLLQKGDLQCFRGCQLLAKEIKELKKNIGAIIEMTGFVSTSKSEKIAMERFSENALIKIIVKKENLGGKIDNGFADVSKYAHYIQGEIIFNAYNNFQVISITKNESQHFWRIVLEYGGMTKIQKKQIKKQKGIIVQELLDHSSFVQKKKKTIESTADIYRILHMHEKQLKCLKKIQVSYKIRKKWISQKELKEQGLMINFKIGNCYFNLRKFSFALEYYQECLIQCEKSNYKANLLFWMSFCCYHKRDNDNRIKYLQQSKAIKEKCQKKDKNYEKILMQLEEIKNGECKKSAQYWEKQLKITKREEGDTNVKYLRYLQNCIIELKREERYSKVLQKIDEGLMIIERAKLEEFNDIYASEEHRSLLKNAIIAYSKLKDHDKFVEAWKTFLNMPFQYKNAYSLQSQAICLNKILTKCLEQDWMYFQTLKHISQILPIQLKNEVNEISSLIENDRKSQIKEKISKYSENVLLLMISLKQNENCNKIAVKFLVVMLETFPHAKLTNQEYHFKLLRLIGKIGDLQFLKKLNIQMENELEIFMKKERSIQNLQIIRNLYSYLYKINEKLSQKSMKGKYKELHWNAYYQIEYRKYYKSQRMSKQVKMFVFNKLQSQNNIGQKFYPIFKYRFPVDFDFLFYLAQHYMTIAEPYEAFSLCFIAIIQFPQKINLKMAQIQRMIQIMDTSIMLMSKREEVQRTKLQLESVIVKLEKMKTYEKLIQDFPKKNVKKLIQKLKKKFKLLRLEYIERQE